jgi:hypothetical protein
MGNRLKMIEAAPTLRVYIAEQAGVRVNRMVCVLSQVVAISQNGFISSEASLAGV